MTQLTITVDEQDAMHMMTLAWKAVKAMDGGHNTPRRKEAKEILRRVDMEIEGARGR